MRSAPSGPTSGSLMRASGSGSPKSPPTDRLTDALGTLGPNQRLTDARVDPAHEDGSARTAERATACAIARSGPAWLIAPEIAEQPQDLQVEPDQRDDEAEGREPGELLVGAVA